MVEKGQWKYLVGGWNKGLRTSPTTLQSEITLGVDDYWWKCACLIEGVFFLQVA